MPELNITRQLCCLPLFVSCQHSMLQPVQGNLRVRVRVHNIKHWHWHCVWILPLSVWTLASPCSMCHQPSTPPPTPPPPAPSCPGRWQSDSSSPRTPSHWGWSIILTWYLTDVGLWLGVVALKCYHPADTLVTEQCAGSASILCVLLLDVDTPPLSYLLCLEVVSAAEPNKDIRTCLV